jgi:hypothetical protein
MIPTSRAWKVSAHGWKETFRAWMVHNLTRMVSLHAQRLSLYMWMLYLHARR